MREIKFRAKRIDDGRWAYGYFVKTPITTEFNCDGQFLDSGVGRYCIIQENVAHEIDIETLGQFTGLLDKNGKEIYEGDILQNGWVIFWQSEYPNYGFYQKSKDGWITGLGIGRKNFKYGLVWNRENPYRIEREDLKVIGNIYESKHLLDNTDIYENPELLTPKT
jgi:uncharacterized phage protein (TIGR01671 family)